MTRRKDAVHPAYWAEPQIFVQSAGGPSAFSVAFGAIGIFVGFRFHIGRGLCYRLKVSLAKVRGAIHVERLTVRRDIGSSGNVRLLLAGVVDLPDTLTVLGYDLGPLSLALCVPCLDAFSGFFSNPASSGVVAFFSFAGPLAGGLDGPDQIAAVGYPDQPHLAPFLDIILIYSPTGPGLDLYFHGTLPVFLSVDSLW
jgi:hypothetical protein